MIRPAALLVVLAACQDNVTTPFPAGLEPFEDNPVPVQQGGARTETLVTQASDANDIIHIYGRGYVLVPPAQVWLAAKMPRAMVALCSTDSQDITANNDPAYEFSFLVHYIVHNFVTVEWNDQWRYGTVLGTPEEPMLAMMKHQKVDGSDFLTLSEGTVQLDATDDPNVTELSFVEHLQAAGGGDSDVTKGVQHNYDAIVATAHGNALPACP